MLYALLSLIISLYALCVELTCPSAIRNPSVSSHPSPSITRPQYILSFLNLNRLGPVGAVFDSSQRAGLTPECI